MSFLQHNAKSYKGHSHLAWTVHTFVMALTNNNLLFQSLIISSMAMQCCTALESHKAKPPSVAAVSKLTNTPLKTLLVLPLFPVPSLASVALLHPATDETFAFRYGPIPPFVIHFYFDASGEKQIDVHIAMAGRHPLFMHDFAITKKHTVSVDTQLHMYYTEMILRGDSLLHSDPTKASRIGVIPRCAKDSLQMRWFDVPGFNNIHAINEWDEEDGNNTRSGGVAANTEADEDNGYVVSYVHDEKTGESKFLVTDAKSPHLDIEAAVKLTQRVPTGSHGLFVREVELRKLYNCKYPIT
ncbi:putative carotenoid cleavage dioxygenase 4 [Citrus sinensis]|uniref:Carotenoid cleavage dioxygenase 4 n=1 Tax=Citrus sinensis TaxID=2711 RepID=A0ACB8K455_CITSI|nr:putative carotenoid cleavage dioxygenase 4 [Citrus sinensis]